MSKTFKTITTEEELGALPTGSIIEKIDNDLCLPGDLPIVAKQSDGEWYGAWGWELDIDPTEIIPATVLYVPTHMDKQ